MADPLSTTASLIAVGQVIGSIISSCYNYQQGLKNARKDVSRIILETQTLRNVIERLLDQVMQDQSSGVVLLPSLARMVSGDESVFENCSKDLVRLEERLRTPVNKWRKVGDRLLWPLRESEIVKEVENMHRMRSVIESGLAIDTAASIREIQKTTRELRERVLDFNRSVKIPDDQRLQVMLEWLDAPDLSARHNMVRKGRTEGTGAWLLQGAEFEGWRDSGEMGVLWMHGIPGCGKSVLTSSLVDNMRHFISADGRTAAMAYFYFQFSDEDNSTVDLMLRSLISQLSFWKGSPPTTLEDYASRHFGKSRYPNRRGVNCKDGISQPSLNELIDILHGITKELGEVFLVIDGLDECAEQDGLHAMVDTMLGWDVKCLHVFLTSRFDNNLYTMMEARNIPIVEVKGQAVDEDIQLFIQEQLASHPRLRKWPPKSRAEIQSSLVKGSQGMFRWVACQIELIAKCVTPRDLKRTLGSLPKSLSASYTSVLAQMDEFQWEYATRILMWLAVSSQPFRMEEAVDALAIDFEAENGPSFDPDLRLQDVDDIIAICSTLVTPCKVITRRHEKVEEFTELRLAHHTVKDYLLSDVFKAHFPKPLAFAREVEVHGFVAKTSITYLLSLQEPLTSESLKVWPLARHAAQAWLDHYVKAGIDHGLAELGMRLLASNGSTEQYRNWCRLYDPTKPWRTPNLERDSFADPLYYVSTCGLDSLVSRLLDHGAEPAVKKGEVHATCLQSAAYNGHHRVVELLLQAGADPNVGGGLFNCPLSASTAQGHNAIIQLLLKYGANPDGPQANNSSRPSLSGRPLHEACWSENAFAVELLLNAGADLEYHSRKAKYFSPLEAAVSRGSKECLRLLLPKSSRSFILWGLEVAVTRGGADSSILELFRDYVPDAVLHHAIALGLDDLAADMLDCGVTRMEIDRSGDRDQLRMEADYSPTGMLYRACQTGNIKAVKRLIEEKVDASGGDETHGPCLAVAAYQGHLDIVKLLVQNGCSLDNGDGIYGGPVQAAVLGNHLEVLGLLVSLGADINQPVGRVKKPSRGLPLTGSPLKAAISTQNAPLMDWLLKHGADANYGGGFKPLWATHMEGIGSPLMIAASNGDLGLTNRLLQAGAEVNQRYEGYHMGPKTALESACKEGQSIVVERLLECGATVALNDAQGNSGSPLFWAVKADSIATLGILLKEGASPNALQHREKGQLTVLGQACKGENAEIVSALIEAGADVHKTSRFADDDEVPIQTAVRHSNVEVVRALLKHGANVNDQTSEGFTALHKAARRGSADILRVLLSEGQADHSLRLINGSQAIHFAAEWNHPECIRLLVEAGADINSQNDSGKTPLHWAVENYGADAVQWLLSNGADAGLVERETNLTPHDYAVLRLEQADSYDGIAAAKVLELLS